MYAVFGVSCLMECVAYNHQTEDLTLFLQKNKWCSGGDRMGGYVYTLLNTTSNEFFIVTRTIFETIKIIGFTVWR